MEEKFLIHPEVRKSLESVSMEKEEYSGFLIAEKLENGLYVFDGDLWKGTEDHGAAWVMTERIVWNFISYPGKFELVPVHSHSKVNGEIIDIIDPYWTANKEMISDQFQRGTVVDGFYVTKKPNAGDGLVAEGMHKRNVNYHLFSHPKHGSESSVMTLKKLAITGYKYNPISIGRVSEIPVVLLDRQI